MPERVVAAVLQALEALEQERLALTRSDVSDDPAHENPLVNAKEPGGALRRAQPSSLSTSAAMLAHIFSASSAFSASARTRTTGSVPDGRTRTRPAIAELRVERARPRREPTAGAPRPRHAHVPLRPAGSACMTAAASLSVPARRAPQRRSAAARPSPVTWSRSQMMWPDCSPPSSSALRSQRLEDVAVSDRRRHDA